MAKKLRQYHVVWEIEVDATSPRDAAKQAAQIQRDSEGVFDVTNEKGKTSRVDLAAA